MIYYKGNELVDMIEELHICGCGCPDAVYKLIHNTMKEIEEIGVRTDATNYYDFMIYQLNHMGFLEHGSSIYSSYITEKGKELLKSLEEMKKYDYDYDIFYENNLVAVDECGGELKKGEER